jgi:4-hydroxybenzoate polyprenyltransferase
MNTIRGIISLMRPYVLLSTTSFYIAAAFLSVNGIPALLPTLLGFLAVALAIASAHTLNDYFDRYNDKDNPRTKNRAIPSGKVSPHLALVLGVIYGLIAVAITFFINLPSIILAFIAIPLPFAYNYMRKRQIPYSFLCTMLAVLFIILLGSAVASGQYLANNILLFVIFGTSWEIGRTLISEVQDVDQDTISDVTTISVTISSKRAAQLIFVLFALAAIMSVTIGFFGQLGILYITVAIATSLWLLYRSLELVREPTTPNAIRMLYQAPKYLVIICLVLIITILTNTLLFGF